MPMSTLERDTVAKTCAVTKLLLYDIQPKLTELKEIYDSGGGVKETLTQEDLDAEEALSGITKAQIDDALYVLTTTLLPAVNAGYASLAQLAARFL